MLMVKLNMNKKFLLGIFLILIAVVSFIVINSDEQRETETTSPTPFPTNETKKITPTENDDQETTILLVYFSNMNRSEDCEDVFSTERQVPVTQSPAREALNLLIDGPTTEEQGQGYSSNVSEDTQINSITIENGIVYVDFSNELDASGSCAVQAIRAQITETLLQFPTIDEVVISIEGETEEILQP